MRMTGGHSGPGQGRLGHMSHGSHGHGMMMQQYPPAQTGVMVSMGGGGHMAPQTHMTSGHHHNMNSGHQAHMQGGEW